MNLLRRWFLLTAPATFWFQADETGKKPWTAVLESLANPKFRAIPDHVTSDGGGIDGTTVGWRLSDLTKVSLDEETLKIARQFRQDQFFFRDVVDLCRSEKELQSFGAVILLNSIYPEWRFDVKIDPYTINASFFIRLHVISAAAENSHILNISQRTFGTIVADHWSRLLQFGVIDDKWGQSPRKRP